MLVVVVVVVFWKGNYEVLEKFWREIGGGYSSRMEEEVIQEEAPPLVTKMNLKTGIRESDGDRLRQIGRAHV